MPNRRGRAARVTGRLRRTQLRTRVLAGVLAVTLLSLAAFDIAAVTALRRYLVHQTGTQLQTVIGQYRSQVPVTDAGLGFTWVLEQRAQAARQAALRRRGVSFSVAPSRTSTVRGKPGPVANFVIVGPRLAVDAPLLDQYYAAFVSRQGAVGPALLHGDPDLRPRLPANLHALAAAGRPVTVVSYNRRAQLMLRAARLGAGTVVATTSLAQVDQTVDQLELIVAIGSAAAALLAAAGVAWLVRRGLRPIESMAAQADRITAGDLTGRVGTQDPQTEVGRLGTALNGMLTRIEASVLEREASQELTRRFFADASHELRNPLASLRANAELYQQGALPERGQVDEAMRRIALEARRMSGLVDDMLRLARLDQHPGQQHEPVDLSAVLEGCAARAGIASPRHGWHVDVDSGLEVTGDEELLRRAFDNLLANVRAHTPAGTVAMIVAAQAGGTVTVQVSDDGPGVPAGQLPHIFDRFYRAGAHRSQPGTGLGLAIVAATAAAHDGTVHAALGHPRGLCITVSLPATGEPVSEESLPVMTTVG
jgi:two-component system, OmpR family, sensor kinase